MQVLELFIMHDAPLYGRQIVRALGLEEGTVYPILHRLQASGYLQKSWAEPEPGRPPRCYYSLRSEGIELFRSLRTRFASAT
jgi:PadR family transcriptional regulator, regulatory protein PadR